MEKFDCFKILNFSLFIAFLLRLSHPVGCQYYDRITTKKPLLVYKEIFNKPDVSAIDDFGRTLDAFKLTNDAATDKNLRETTWASLGDARLLEGPGVNEPLNLSLFHWTKEGFTASIQMMTPKQSALLADAATKKYNVSIAPRQVIQLALSSFNCILPVTKDGEQQPTLVKGIAKDLKKFPVVIEFTVPNMSKRNSLFRKRDLLSSKDDGNLTCTLQSIDQALHEKMLKLTSEQSRAFIEANRMAAPATSSNSSNSEKEDFVYLTKEQLNILSSKIYATLNISQEYTVTLAKFQEKFNDRLVTQRLLEDFLVVPIDIAFKKLSLFGFPVKTDLAQVLADISSLLDIAEIDNNEAISVQINSKSKLKKTGKYQTVKLTSPVQVKIWGVFNLGESLSMIEKNFEDWASNELSISDQLSNVNQASYNDITWALNNNNLTPQNITVAKFKLFEFANGLTFDGFNKTYRDYAVTKTITLPFHDAKTIDGIQMMENNIIAYMTETISKLLARLDKLEDKCNSN